MKVKILLPTLLFFIPLFIIAQISNSEIDTNKNYVSIDPLLPFLGTIQVQYEREVGNKMSVSLSMGYKFSSGILDVSELDFDRFVSDKIDFRGIKIIPEIRWYFQNNLKGLQGFYLGSYFKYQNRDGQISGRYFSSDTQSDNILIDTDMDSYNFGLQIGYKLEFKNCLFLDFIIAGPGISYNTISLTEIEPVPQAFYDDITDSLKRLGIIDWLDPDFEINGNQSSSLLLPAFRYGIKIGYSF